ncbi:TPA: alpha/beta hydrolase [Candidatus Woesearchaeota archaeon]|nr:alpha/beta hydrolase [Candidatus Woesearchaeota archaeon]
MSRWRDIQKGLIQQAIYGLKEQVLKENIQAGLVYGTIFYRKESNRKRWVVLVAGINNNRYTLSVLAERLASYGFMVLSIDPPSHYLNPNELKLGIYSQTVTEAVLLLKRNYGAHSVGVVGYSLGAIAALFSMVGYDLEVESRIYRLWEQMAELLERSAAGGFEMPNRYQFLGQADRVFGEIKQLVLNALRKRIVDRSDGNCYVFIELPGNAKNFIPGLSCLRKVRIDWTKKLIEVILHNPTVKIIQKAGNPVNYIETPQGPDEARWLFLTTRKLPELLEYLSKMKDPKDYLKLVEELSAFKNKDDAESFFGYYLKKYVWLKPKLFMYGKYDIILRPFLPGGRKRLEHYYTSCGNALVIRGDYSHMVSNQGRMITGAALTVTHEPTTAQIIRFLENNI